MIAIMTVTGPDHTGIIAAVSTALAELKVNILDVSQTIMDNYFTMILRVELDDRDTYSAGWKFSQWEMKGVPVRLELGPRDIENGVAMSMRRDTLEKKPLQLDGIADTVKALLDDIHNTMFEQARAFRDAHIYTATTLEELEKGVQNGFVKAAWCGCRECEDKVKELYNASTRNMPFDQSDMPSDKCVVCGKPAEKLIYFAKAY